ncbi:hypothetical protein NMY22_g10715 [Coprinellus aureogranulatus]|nr:hypothetical protein NMY22_g10715 [Coprinellus aureogranulatus]
MSTAALQENVAGKEHIIVVGAGFNGLMCALEAQERKANRQVDIVAQTFVTDPAPMAWTTYLSRCFFGCLKTSTSNLGQITLNYMLAKATSSPELVHKFSMTEYFSMDHIEDSMILTVQDMKRIPAEDLAPEAKHGATFTTISISPVQLAQRMQYDFASKGGRVLRGTVRHIRELAEGGVSSFQRLPMGEDCFPPTAIVICVGVGARFLGGVEDSTVIPTRILVLRLRIPSLKTGKAFYDSNEAPSLFLVPLGNGDVILGGKIEYECWYPKPTRRNVDALLARALSVCPEIIPPGVTDRGSFDLRSLIVWEGCDVFGRSKQGPRLESQRITCLEGKRAVPIILSYGHGASELQVHREVAKVTIDLMESAIEQEQGLNSVT